MLHSLYGMRVHSIALKIVTAMAAPWVLQRAGVTIPAGDEPDTHDDFKPVQKQADSLSPVHEAIEKVICFLFLTCVGLIDCM